METVATNDDPLMRQIAAAKRADENQPPRSMEERAAELADACGLAASIARSKPGGYTPQPLGSDWPQSTRDYFAQEVRRAKRTLGDR
jgi:hypothetical protein